MQNAMLETLHLAVCKRQKADLIFNLLILKDFFYSKTWHAVCNISCIEPETANNS